MEESFKILGLQGALDKLYEDSQFRRCYENAFECTGDFAVSADRMLLEGADFTLDNFPLQHLGYKAVLLVSGDLLAALAAPRTLKMTLAVSAKLDYPQIKQIWEGACSAAKEFGYADFALSLQPSLTGLCISVLASGNRERTLAASRPIAGSMDLICVSNDLGAAFLGERILEKCAGLEEKKRMEKLQACRQMVGAYLKPEIPANILSSLKESGIVPSFGYFCTRPVSSVIRELCRRSGLGAKIYVDRIPFAGGSIDAAGEFGIDPVQAAMKGGDDSCFLFTIPLGSHDRFRHDFQSWDIIGHLAKPEVGAVLVSPDGLEHEL